jgi:hypothetical protein
MIIDTQNVYKHSWTHGTYIRFSVSQGIGLRRCIVSDLKQIADIMLYVEGIA